MFKVTVKPEVARLRSGDTGTRNVKVGAVIHTFSRNPTFMAEVPAEVVADPYLVVTATEDPPPPPAEAPRAGKAKPVPFAEDDDYEVVEGGDAPADAEPAPEEEDMHDETVKTDPKSDPDKINKANIKRRGRRPKATKG